MAGRMRCFLWWIIGGPIVLVILLVLFVYSGIYNVSATYKDIAPVAWVFDKTMENSVHRHAAGIKAPALDDPAMVRMGFSQYRMMCAGCHGAPGVQERRRALLNPQPPKLVEAAGDWKPNELFWIVKNGVRMTAMPSFGAGQSDQTIWTTVAFLVKLPSITPAEYEKMNRQIPMPKRP